MILQTATEPSPLSFDLPCASCNSSPFPSLYVVNILESVGGALSDQLIASFDPSAPQLQVHVLFYSGIDEGTVSPYASSTPDATFVEDIYPLFQDVLSFDPTGVINDPNINQGYAISFRSDEFPLPITTVPEPGTSLLLAGGLVALAQRYRLQKSWRRPQST